MLYKSAVPFVWIGLIWFVVFIWLLLNSLKSSFIKFVWLNLAVVVLTLTAYESYLAFAVQRPSFVGPREKHTETNEFLGYKPINNHRHTATKMLGDQIVYEATYTHDEHGLRESPPCDGENAVGDVLFFGGSFTYGMGVNDNQTMPFQVGLMTERQFCIHNFGLQGYGPHQMLSALEHGIVARVVPDDGKIKVGIYLAITDHLSRAAGRSTWDQHGPRYLMAPSGEVRFSGNFDDNTGFSKSLARHLRKSFTYNRIAEARTGAREMDLELFLGIVNASRKTFESLYEKTDFHVIFWDNPQIELSQKTAGYLKGKMQHLHLITEIIPDIHQNKELYRISEHDGHPSAHTHGLIAEYVVSNILAENSDKR